MDSQQGFEDLLVGKMGDFNFSKNALERYGQVR